MHLNQCWNLRWAHSHITYVDCPCLPPRPRSFLVPYVRPPACMQRNRVSKLCRTRSTKVTTHGNGNGHKEKRRKLTTATSPGLWSDAARVPEQTSTGGVLWGGPSCGRRQDHWWGFGPPHDWRWWWQRDNVEIGLEPIELDYTLVCPCARVDDWWQWSAGGEWHDMS